jgi:2-alkenal reductase
MTFLRRYPIPTFIILIVLTSLACQGFMGFPAVADPPTPAPVMLDEEAIAGRVLATVEAQLAITAQEAPVIVQVEPPRLDFDLQAALIDVYNQVNPSVVHIFVYGTVRDVQLPLGTGSGFVYDEEGHIVTNNHVVADGDSYEVVFADGSLSRAMLVGADVDSDLAVIKVDSLPLSAPPVRLSDSTQLQVGQFAVAIGNPFGETGSMSVGIISGLGRALDSQRITEGGGRYTLPEVIQTDAAINPGNSGGPLLNLNGEVIGVNSAILTRTGTNSGVGFSIPVNAVKRVVPALVRDGRYVYPYMGISMIPLTPALQERLELDETFGAYVTNVAPGSPAAAAGLIGSNGPGGDLITAIDGRPVRSTEDLISHLVFNAEVGQTVDLTVVRGGEEITVPLTLGERP